ncbi:MAG: hypothetical protein A2539_04955, partial [Elusimicrobia bacterium RIFOXYD2_FULL_34_15]
ISFFILNILFIIDISIYQVFRFHINGFALNILLSKGGWESLEFNLVTYILIILAVICTFLLEYFAYNKITKLTETKEYFLNFRKIALLFAGLFLIVFIDKGIFAYADLHNISYITRHSRLFPLYQSLTINKFANKYFNIEIDKSIHIKLDKKYSGLNYPKMKLEFSDAKIVKLPNIIWILTDSFRYDMFNKDVTPNTHEFSKKSSVFYSHYSGGNCSRFGVFSLFYGLNGYYWNSVLGERQSPLFLDVLKGFNYDFKILASSKLNFPEFTKTCFVDIPVDKIFDEPLGDTKYKKDEIIANEFIKYISQKRDNKPFFSFIFFDSAHGSYDFPADFEKFKPTVTSFNYLLLNKNNILPVFNRYKNAVYYDDFLIGKIISNLTQKGFLKNTIVVISADHGEAFFEKGFYGHNHGFCDEQVKVPLVLYIPGHKHREYFKLTSHNDIIPTIMPFLGCENKPEDYSQGSSLLEKNEREFVLSSTWNEIASIDKKYTAVMSFETYNIRGIKTFDSNYQEVFDKKITENMASRFVNAQKEIMSFFK